MIPRKKHPNPWYNIHDVSRGSISTDEFLYRWARNDFFCLKFVRRSKYYLEIFKTWEKLSCSHILYFVCFFKDRRARVWKQNSRGFIDRKRILGILSLLLTYSCTYDFRRLSFPNFITNIKRLLLKKVSLKFLYKENVH